MAKLADRPASWFEIARRPKWLGGLAVAMIAALICGGLAQWQLDRSIADQAAQAQRQNELKVQTPVALETLVQPNQHLRADNTSRLVSFKAEVDRKSWLVVKGRIQIDSRGIAQTGYWMMAKAVTESGALIPIVVNWDASLVDARASGQIMESDADRNFGLQNFVGYLEYPEPPQNQDPKTPWMVSSVSTAQLINLWSPDQKVDAYEGFVILKTVPSDGFDEGATPVTFRPGDSKPLDANWLNVFYGIEWSFFAVFAFFMWWRLVEDQRKKELSVWLAERQK